MTQSKALAALLLAFILTGCAGGAAKTYTAQQVVQMPEWKKLAARLIIYERLVCKCAKSTWKLGIVKSDKVNAFSLGGGKFLVTEGLLKLPFEEQDAALAHEVGHEVSGHVAKRQAASAITTGAFVVLGAIIPGAGLLNHVVNPLVVAAYSKEQELDADSIAVYLLQTTYNDKSAAQHMRALLQRFESLESSSKGGLFANHPHPKDRIQAVEDILAGTKQAKLPPSYESEEESSGSATGAGAEEDSGKAEGDL